MDLIFAIDIVFRFRTTYIDPISGEEVLNEYMIAKRYITSRTFYFDVISTVPFDSLISEVGIFQFFGLFKLLRIFRISKVIANLN